MALEIGDINVTSGLSKKIYNDMIDIFESINAFTYINENNEIVSWSEENIDIFKERLKKTSYSTAKSIVEYFKDNADTNVTSNILVDSAFWTWFIAFIGVLTASGGIVLSPAMTAFLITNPIPTSISSSGNGSSLTTQGIN